MQKFIETLKNDNYEIHKIGVLQKSHIWLPKRIIYWVICLFRFGLINILQIKQLGLIKVS